MTPSFRYSVRFNQLLPLNRDYRVTNWSSSCFVVYSAFQIVYFNAALITGQNFKCALKNTAFFN